MVVHDHENDRDRVNDHDFLLVVEDHYHANDHDHDNDHDFLLVVVHRLDLVLANSLC